MFRPDRGAARKTARAPSRCRGDQIFPEHADARQVAIALHVIEPVTDHEFVPDLEANVIGVDVTQPRFLFLQQHANADALRSGIYALDFLANARQGNAAIQDVVEKKDVPPRDVRHPELAEDEFPRGLGSTVITGDAQAIQLQRHGKAPEQICHQDHAAVENRDDGQLAVAIIIRDLSRQLVEPAMNRGFVDKNPFEVRFHCLKTIQSSPSCAKRKLAARSAAVSVPRWQFMARRSRCGRKERGRTKLRTRSRESSPKVKSQPARRPCSVATRVAVSSSWRTRRRRLAGIWRTFSSASFRRTPITSTTTKDPTTARRTFGWRSREPAKSFRSRTENCSSVPGREFFSSSTAAPRISARSWSR